jgi:CrcB protein
VRRAGLIAAGGAAGALVRLGLAATLPWNGGWPWSTLAVNLAGSLLLGLVAGSLARRPERGRVLRPLLAIGFLGALTTMSGFALELVDLSREGRVPSALAYAGVTVGGGLALAHLGLRRGAAR